MERYNPKTYMRLLRQLIGVVKPAEVKEMKAVQMAVESWEVNAMRLEEEYGETLGNNLKVAILISMVPMEVQEKIFEMERGTEEIRYDQAKAVVVSMALRRAEQRRPREDELMAVERRREQEYDGERWAWGTEVLAAVETGMNMFPMRGDRAHGQGVCFAMEHIQRRGER